MYLISHRYKTFKLNSRAEKKEKKKKMCGKTHPTAANWALCNKENYKYIILSPDFISFTSSTYIIICGLFRNEFGSGKGKKSTNWPLMEKREKLICIVSQYAMYTIWSLLGTFLWWWKVKFCFIVAPHKNVALYALHQQEKENARLS